MSDEICHGCPRRGAKKRGGWKLTPETRAKIAAAKRGEKNPNWGGKSVTERSRESSRANIARIRESPQWRAAVSESKLGEKNPNWGGATMTEETRRKLSAAAAGRPLSDDHRKKLSGMMLAKWQDPDYQLLMIMARQDPEYRRKLSDASRGRRHAPETLEKMRGPNAYHWRGGISFEPYCPKFNNEFKERVRDFFGRCCVECGAPEAGYKLHVHHVNFEKMACCAEGVAPLFVPLCRSCHAKTTANREYFEARYTALIMDEYGGRCYLPRGGDE